MTENYTATANVIAITDLQCISIPYRRNAAVLKQNLAFINRVGRELALKLRRSSGNYISSALFSGEERLCFYIMQTAHNDIFSGNLTDVSSSVSISYRHMFRLLNQLCKEGILEKKKNGYKILNRDALSERAFSKSE